MGLKRLCVLLTVSALMMFGTSAWARDAKSAFFLHDGDRVVFYGDSITEQQMYGRDIETFVATRYPKMHVTFLNSGWSGDRVTGGGGGPIDVRLNRDVLPYKPTVVTILLGMNDGNYTTFNTPDYQTYTRGITHIVDVLTQKLPGVRLVLLTPTFFDYGARDRQLPPPGQGYSFGSPAPDYNQTLLKYGDFLRQFGAQRHLPVVDMNAPMQAATEAGRRTDPKFALSAEGVHPNEIGHLIMAAAILTAWNVQPTIATMTLRPGQFLTITPPLPWPVPSQALPAFTLSPLPGALDVFRLSGTDLNPHSFSYGLDFDGSRITTMTGAQLAAGIDMSQFPTSQFSILRASNVSQDQQAQQVLSLVNQRINTWHDFFKGSNGIAHPNDVPSDAEIASLTAENDSLDALRTQEAQAAQPTQHMFQALPAPAAHP